MYAYLPLVEEFEIQQPTEKVFPLAVDIFKILSSSVGA